MMPAGKPPGVGIRLIEDEDGPVGYVEPLDRDPPAEVPSLDGRRYSFPLTENYKSALFDSAKYVREFERVSSPPSGPSHDQLDRYARDHSPEALAARKALLERDPLQRSARVHICDEVDPIDAETSRRRALPRPLREAADRAEESARLNKARRRW